MGAFARSLGLLFGIVFLVGSTQGSPLNILIDASKDGGVWWFPQAEVFDPNAAHQGKALADRLRALGHTVDEVPRGAVVSLALFSSYDLVVRTNLSNFSSYAAGELTTYGDYVTAGGKVLLLGQQNSTPDPVGQVYGLTLQGRASGLLDTFASHPVTQGLTSISYSQGTGLTTVPGGVEVLGNLASGTFLDVDQSGSQETGEPGAPAVFGRLSFGAGEVVFFGEIFVWLDVTQPLVDNVINWFAGSLAPAFTLGDGNGDGVLDAADLVAILLEISDGDGSSVNDVAGGTFAGTGAVDVNGDDLVDLNDVTYLVQLLFQSGV